MNEFETNFILWGCGVLLFVLSGIGGLAVKQLMKMADDLNSIKITIGRIDEKHDALQDRVNKIEEKIF